MIEDKIIIEGGVLRVPEIILTDLESAAGINFETELA